MLKILISILFALILTSCSQESEQNTLIVATSADNPPYEYIKDGVVVGFDIDIINAIGASLDKKIVIKNLDFPALLPALVANNVDLVIAAITMTEERKAHIDFSDSYAATTLAVMFKKEDGFKSLNNLQKKVIGVQAGSTWEIYVKDLVSQIPEIRIRALANNLILVEELKAGNVDAIVMEEMQVKKFEQNVANISSFVLIDAKQEFAIALPKGSALTSEINGAISKLKESGELKKIKDKWM